MDLKLWLYKRFRNKYLRRYLTGKILKLEGGQAYSKTIRKIYEDLYNIKIGYGTYGGCFDLANIPRGVEFGNYCSIAGHVRIFRANHPEKLFTTHPLLYNPVMGHVKADLLDRPPLKIGHDVWIGSDVIILPSVKNIGNGSIIGAGSIVTKDVEPYSIVVGNPAKLKRKRFSANVILKLEATNWWNLEKDELIQEIARLNNLVND